MKKYFVGIFLILLSSFLVVNPPRVFAHFLNTVEDMGITLHVDPDDDPIPGKQANLYFLFSNNFNLGACSCTITIKEQGKQIFQQQLIEEKASKPSIWGTNMPYIFPRNDVYQIIINGQPKIKNAFQPFQTSWYFDVDTDNPGLVKEPHSDISTLLAVSIGGVIVFVLLGIFIKKQIIDIEGKIENSAKKK